MVGKKGVSSVISYVILISIVVVMSVGVYAFLKTYVPKDVAECPPGVSFFVQGVSINADSNSLDVKILNNGLFNVSGFLIRGSKDADKVPTIDLSGSSSGMLFISNSEPDKTNLFGVDDEKNFSFDLSGIESPQDLVKVEIVPIMFTSVEVSEELKLAVCKNSNIVSKLAGECVPNCKNKVCGEDDGCGGKCTYCEKGVCDEESGNCLVYSCVDSDVNLAFPDGKNYYVFGNTSGSDGASEFLTLDACDDTEILNESICVSIIDSRVQYNCSVENKICSGGKCIPKNLQYCGDGQLQIPQEQCDVNNPCPTIKIGWNTIAGNCNDCLCSYCGNKIVETGESCDRNASRCDDHNPYTTDQCNSDCSCSHFNPYNQSCGNGQIGETGSNGDIPWAEQCDSTAQFSGDYFCDDHNDLTLDKCENCICKHYIFVCGNGVADPGETCNNCAQDMGFGQCCGDGVCETFLREDCSNCCMDCMGKGVCGTEFVDVEICGDGISSLKIENNYLTATAYNYVRGNEWFLNYLGDTTACGRGMVAPGYPVNDLYGFIALDGIKYKSYVSPSMSQPNPETFYASPLAVPLKEVNSFVHGLSNRDIDNDAGAEFSLSITPHVLNFNDVLPASPGYHQARLCVYDKKVCCDLSFTEGPPYNGRSYTKLTV